MKAQEQFGIRKSTRKFLDKIFKDKGLRALLDRMSNPPCNDPICKERDCIIAQMKQKEVINAPK